MDKCMCISDGIVSLRSVEESDVDFLWQIDLEPKPFDEDCMAPRSAVKNNFDQGRYWSDRSHVYVIELQQHDGGPVGTIGSSMSDKTERIDIGTTIAARWRGRGIGTRAKRLLIDYLFRAYPCHRITANTSVLNTPAIRSLEKSGFSYEGTAKRDKFIHGEFRDFAYYAILRDEYEEARKSWLLSGNTTPVKPNAINESEGPRHVLKGNLIQLRPFDLDKDIKFITDLFTFAFPYNHQDLCSIDEIRKENETDDPFWGEKHRGFIIETHDGTPIGNVGLWDYDKHNQMAEVGTFILPQMDRGKGYGTEAKLLCMGYGFDIWPLNRIWACTSQYNRAARCSLSRAGLRYFGVTSGVQIGARVPAGVAFYSVTRDEWMNSREVCDA